MDFRYVCGVAAGRRKLQIKFAGLLPFVVLTVLSIARAQTSLAVAPEKANGQAVALQPSQFPELPEPIRQTLRAERCMVPQTVHALYNNVIRGEFAQAGQHDWAILCSQGGVSHIRVFWGGPVRCPSRVAFDNDSHYLLQTPDGHYAYWRAIHILDKHAVLTHLRAYGLASPVPVEHDAINDAFIEKGSVIHYCYEGEWRELAGAD